RSPGPPASWPPTRPGISASTTARAHWRSARMPTSPCSSHARAAIRPPPPVTTSSAGHPMTASSSPGRSAPPGCAAARSSTAPTSPHRERDSGSGRTYSGEATLDLQSGLPPPCGEGTGVGVAREPRTVTQTEKQSRRTGTCHVAHLVALPPAGLALQATATDRPLLCDFACLHAKLIIEVDGEIGRAHV